MMCWEDADPTVLRVLGLRLLQGGWTQTNENPFAFLPVSVGGRWLHDMEQPRDEPERHLRPLCSNRSSIP